MPASLTDKFNKVGVAGTLTSLSAPGKALAASSITVGSTSNWPTDTAVVLAIRQVDSNGEQVANTYTEWLGTVSGTTITIDPTPVYGADQVYPAGSTTQVFIPVSAYAHNRLIDALLTEHDQDGAHKSVTTDTLTTTGNVTVGGTSSFANGEALYKDAQYFTASGTWTKPTNLKFVIVELVGGGGAGGGTNATGGTQYAVGAGGGAGCYARKKILASALGSTETVTVGAGTAGAATTTAQATGGTSSFGVHCTGAGGGSAAGVIDTVAGRITDAANGGTTGTGDLIIPGGNGGIGRYDNSNANIAMSGFGGASYIGQGGRGVVANNNGQPGRSYGGGGSGAARSVSQVASAGGSGASGIVIVHEYF